MNAEDRLVRAGKGDMMRTTIVSRRASVVALVGVLLAAGTLRAEAARSLSAQVEVPAELRSPADCGDEDTPEPGIQGDLPFDEQISGGAVPGYNCGLAVVGYHDLGGLGGGAMARSGHCAYVVPESGGGILVVDVSDPAAPQVTTVLPTAVSSENIAAARSKGRALLVAAGANKTVDVYDVHNCGDPRLLGQIHYPPSPTVVQHVHNINLSPDTTKVYGTMPLTMADISDLGDPSTWEVRTFQCDLARQISPAHREPVGLCDLVPPDEVYAVLVPGPQIAHFPELDPTGTRMYVGGQQAFLPDEEYLHVVDMTEWPPRVVPGSQTFGSGHDVNYATIEGRRHVLNSGEGGVPGGGCVPTRPLDAPPPTGLPIGPDDSLDYSHANAAAYLTDVHDESAPKRVSRLRLAINHPRPAVCAAQVASSLGPACSQASSAATKGCTATPHYSNVDDPDDTTFAMLSMMTAGLRVFDIRDPVAPIEVAYFNPGLHASDGGTVVDPAGSRPYYIPSTGHIWLTTRAGGFWVLELEPQVRRLLGLPMKEHRHPTGRPAGGADEESPDVDPAALAISQQLGRFELPTYCRLPGPRRVP